MGATRFEHLSDHALRTEIRAMEFELKVRADPKWTGRYHDWDKPFEHPLVRQCKRCTTLMVPPGLQIDFRDGVAVSRLQLREDCPR